MESEDLDLQEKYIQIEDPAPPLVFFPALAYFERVDNRKNTGTKH